MTAAKTPHGAGRALLAAGAAILALALVTMLAIASSGTPSPGPTSARAPDAAPVTAAPPPPAAAVPAAVQVPSPAPPAPPREWADVALAVRLSDLGPLARDVYGGLKRAREAMEPCYEADATDAAAHPRAPNEEDGWGAAIVTLQMEGRPGGLVILNAPLQAIGSSSMSLVECCERVLRGFVIPSAGAVPGRRYRLQHQLTQ